MHSTILRVVKHQSFMLWLTIFIAIAAILMALPRFEVKIDRQIGPVPIKIDTVIGGYNIDANFFGLQFKRNLKFQPGLDLQGGVQAVLEADMSQIDPSLYNDALDSVKNVIERRVNFLGVTEPNIYSSVNNDKYRIVIELPGVTDTQKVVELLGQTAQLDFREENPDAKDPKGTDLWLKTDLTGKYLKRAQVGFDPRTGAPQVQLSFDEKGKELFAAITQRNINKRLAIFLDETPITAPTVNTAILDGEAVISGQFTLDEAKDYAIQFNAGALPAPVSIISQKNIGPTLGQDTVNKSIFAGLIGLLLVAVFMVINYRLLGVFSIIGLVIYGSLTVAIYKFVPITLTLSGIAGFILSIGMAVDSNILIFERIREELRMGKDTFSAISIGFTRAWDSIRDANTATLITVFLLFNPMNWDFLVTSGTVRGFALTLGLGVLLSLLTGVVLSKTLIFQFYPMKKGQIK